MKLKFRARAGGLVAWPGLKSTGSPPRYVGRSYVPGDGKTTAASFPADKEPAEIADTDPDAPHLVRQCRKGGLWAADQATAAVCGVDLQNVSQDADGEWIAAKERPAPTAKTASKES